MHQISAIIFLKVTIKLKNLHYRHDKFIEFFQTKCILIEQKFSSPQKHKKRMIVCGMWSCNLVYRHAYAYVHMVAISYYKCLALRHLRFIYKMYVHSVIINFLPLLMCHYIAVFFGFSPQSHYGLTGDMGVTIFYGVVITLLCCAAALLFGRVPLYLYIHPRSARACGREIKTRIKTRRPVNRTCGILW